MFAETVFIGDVHGCSRELALLMESIPQEMSGRIIFMGDLVNKGPDPEGVLRIVQAMPCRCLRGNHENDHLRWAAGTSQPKSESILTKAQMSAAQYEAYLAMAAAMPVLISEDNFVAVHAAVQSGISLENQDPEILTGGVTLDPSWIKRIDLARPLVVGHKRYGKDPAIPYVRDDRFYGIDTGCVYGGALTALYLPSGKLVQVPAKKRYAAK